MSRVILVALFMMLAANAIAQECEIAAYADPAGTQSWIISVGLETAWIHVVIHADNTVAAAAYSMSVPRGAFLQDRYTGPSRGGLFLDEPTGTNSALGECVVGFGGNPVLVDAYWFYFIPDFGEGAVTLGPNQSQDPQYPQYVTCNDITLDCEVGPDLIIGTFIPTDATSFSEIKSLYGKD